MDNLRPHTDADGMLVKPLMGTSPLSTPNPLCLHSPPQPRGRETQAPEEGGEHWGGHHPPVTLLWMDVLLGALFCSYNGL